VTIGEKTSNYGSKYLLLDGTIINNLIVDGIFINKEKALIGNGVPRTIADKYMKEYRN
jgi:hypothetical protein